MIPTTDLQLGDWVRIYDIEQQAIKATGQIWEIRQEDVTVDTDGTDAGMWYCTDLCLQPIPITTAILEKNSWFTKDGAIWFKKGPVRMGWYKKNCEFIAGYHTMPFIVEFVHQLQHVIKMLGMEDDVTI